MRCPNSNCQSERLKGLNTYTKVSQAGMAQEFTLTNMTRRRKYCLACSNIFFTIEISEAEYRRLRAVYERNLAQPKVRP